MRIQTGLGTNNRQEIDREKALEALREMGVLASPQEAQAPPQEESILSHGRYAPLYNLAFLAGIIVMLVGFGATLDGTPLSGGLWNFELFLPGMILLVSGLGLGLLGGSGSEYA